jgi:membrane protein
MLSRFRAAAAAFSENNGFQMGAALAYYALFSLTPMLLLAIAFLGMVYGEKTARDEVIEQLRGFVDKRAADAADAVLEGTEHTPSLASMSVVGVASLLFGASGLFISLRSSLHRIWRIEAHKEEGFVWGLVKNYLLATVMVAVACAFVLLLMLSSALAHRLVSLPSLSYSGPVVDLVISTLLLTVLFTVTYHVLSDYQLGVGQVWFGAMVSAILFTLGKMAIGLYLGYVDLASAYGAFGSVVVFLAWVYYSAQILFFGAEVVRTGLPEGKATQV